MDVYLEDGLESNGFSGRKVHEAGAWTVSVGSTNAGWAPRVVGVYVCGCGVSIYGGPALRREWDSLETICARDAFAERVVLAGLAASPGSLARLVAETKAAGHMDGRHEVQSEIRRLLGIS